MKCFSDGFGSVEASAAQFISVKIGAEKWIAYDEDFGVTPK